MPASAVPVDMVSEDLRATITPLPKPSAYGEAHSLSRAEVHVEYVLRTDDRVTVPVLFPIVLEADDVRFTLNGHGADVRRVSDLELLRPYEAAWRKTIDDLIASDPTLRQIAADAADDLAKSRQATAARAAEQAAQSRPAHETAIETLHISTRLQPQLATRLQQLGRPTTDALLWGLTHYLLDDWEARWGGKQPHAGADDPELVERTRLWVTRDVAVGLEPKAPDPVALWDSPPFQPLVSRMSFAVAELELKAGENRFSVSYQQRTSFVNRRPLHPASPMHEGHRQVSDFRFILQTARFWRSFGDLRVDVALPGGTVFAECSLPGARIDSPAAPRRVTYSGPGLPDTNLSVLFADFAPAPPDGEYRPQGEVPLAEVPLLWQAVVSRDSAYAHAAPVADAQSVVCAVSNGAVICDRATGSVLKTLEFEGGPSHLALLPDRVLIGLSRPSGHQYSAHPSVMSFDRRTGKHQWTAEMPPGSGRAFSARPVLAGDTVVAWTDRHGLFAANLSDGALLWQERFGCRAVALSDEARQGAGDGLVFVAGQGSTDSTHLKEKAGWVFAVALRTGETRWTVKLGQEVAGLGVADDSIYAYTGLTDGGPPTVAVLGARDGVVRAKYEFADRHAGFNQVWDVLARDGRLLVVSDDAVLAYDRRQPAKALWRMPYYQQARSAPAIEGDFIYVGSTRGLLKGDLRAGRWLWEAKPAGNPATGRCGVYDGVILAVQSLGGVLTAWQADKASVATAEPPRTPFGQPPDDLPQRLTGSDRGGGLHTQAVVAPLAVAAAALLSLMLVRRRRRAR